MTTVKNMAQIVNDLDRAEQFIKITRLGPATVPRMLPPMLIDIVWTTSGVDYSYERSGRDIIFRIPPRPPKLNNREDAERIDAFATRDLFIKINTPGDALEFLNATGYFRFPHGMRPLKWSEFKLWQDLIRIRMIEKTFESLSQLPSHLEPILANLSYTEQHRLWGSSDGDRMDSRALVASMFCHSTVEAMLAAVNADHLRRINYQLCKLDGCSNVFEVNRPDKEYCSHACAHKASVYKKRERLKKEKEAAKTSEAVRSNKKQHRT